MDHGRGGFSDYSNSLFGTLNLAMAGSRYRYDTSMRWVSGDDAADPAAEEKAAARRFQELRMAAHIARYAGGWR